MDHQLPKFLLLLAALWKSEADQKQWRHDINWHNAEQWSLLREPCHNDRVLFPSTLDVLVRIPEGLTSLREMVFPRNGDILLPWNGNLMISGEKAGDQRCPGQDIKFVQPRPSAWMDPTSWKNLDLSPSAPVPHLEQIPCTADVAVFPAHSSFYLQMPEERVAVASVTIDDNELSPTDWQEFLQSEVGQRQILTNTWNPEDALHLTGSVGCDDASGCVCHAAAPDPTPALLGAVCAFAAPRCGAAPPCLHPVVPFGSCCPLCGAYVILEINGDFKLNWLNSVIADKYGDVLNFYASKLPSRLIQVILVDKGSYGGKSAESASSLADYLQKNAGSSNGVVKVVDIISAGPSTTGNSALLLVGVMFGTLFAVLFALGIIYYFYLGPPVGLMLGKSGHAFVFARFENAPGDADTDVLKVETPVYQVVEDVSASQSFDNPMYGSSARSQDRSNRENIPLYSDLQRKDSLDEVSVESTDK